jgi:transcriptional regulator with XRE-family HTH domain
LLRELRTGVRLTQAELAEASGVSLRSVSDLERGRVAVPHGDTVRLLADALNLIGPVRVQFEALTRGRPLPDGG